MTYDHHPLMRHLEKTGETLTMFAKRCEISRTHLYRIMRGENTSLRRISLLCKATGDEVSVTDFLVVEAVE
jgi:predicted transcriptional regulator